MLKLTLAVAAASGVALAEPTVQKTFTATVDSTPATEKWTAFKKLFNKTYSAGEELRRFGIFVHNLERAARMQAMDSGTAVYSWKSKFADWSEEEFARYNTLKAQDIDRILADAKTAPLLPPVTDSSFDWRKKGNVVNPVKDQGQCGSCWTFGTAANIEGVNALNTGTLLSLSEQEIVDCSDSDDGCNGGLPSRAYQDMINEGWGLETEDAYPYHAVQGTCNKDQDKEKVFIDDWTQISQDEDQIAAALVKYGPLAIGVNASPLQMYFGGILDPWFCSPSGIDHAVTLVGYGEEDGKKYWIIRNSWAASWGEEGYYRMVRGKGACGMNRMVTTALMNSSTVEKNKAVVSRTRSTRNGGSEIVVDSVEKKHPLKLNKKISVKTLLEKLPEIFV